MIQFYESPLVCVLVSFFTCSGRGHMTSLSSSSSFQPVGPGNPRLLLWSGGEGRGFEKLQIPEERVSLSWGNNAAAGVFTHNPPLCCSVSYDGYDQHHGCCSWFRCSTDVSRNEAGNGARLLPPTGGAVLELLPRLTSAQF